MALTTLTGVSTSRREGKAHAGDVAGPHIRARLRPRQQLAPAAPFVAIALAGQITSVVSPSNAVFFWVSTLLLLVTACLLTFRVGGRHAVALAACMYVISVGFLMQANGGLTSGVGSLFFVAIVAVALYGDRRESIVVVGAVVVTLFIVSVSNGVGPETTVRRLALFCGIGCVLSFSVHALRDRLTASNVQTTRLLHEAEALNAAAERLAALVDPAGIAALGAELGAQIASPPGGAISEARYLGVHDGTVVPRASFGQGRDADLTATPLEQHSALSESIRTLEPRSGSVVSAAPHNAARAAMYGVWVPVCLNGQLHGVLEVTIPETPISPECLQRCVALGHLLELALSNWAAHEELAQQATAEERRRIARDLHDGLAHELAFIASKASRASVGPDAKELAGAADRALDEARRAITVLSSSQPQSFSAALNQTAEDLGARLGVPVHVQTEESFDVEPPVAEQLLRVTREALTNAAVHGQPNAVTITLRGEHGMRQLVIDDDGRGFNPRLTDGSGFGLVSMRERAASIGAGFTLDSAPGRGTTIEVTLP